VRSSAAGYLLGNYYNSKTMVIRFFTDDASTFESKKTALEAYLYDLIPVKAQVSYEFVSPN
jgi:hypothetical protein